MGTVSRSLGIMPLVKFDEETEEPVRGPDGRCVRCGPGEPGELLGLIAPGDPTREFKGYLGNKEGTAKKILRGVFRPGDTYFRTGDLLKRDEAGYFYFLDRIGDTFRWKGENVATTEVAEAFAGVKGLAEAIVYGVLVPGHDGRAGMASLVLDAPAPREGGKGAGGKPRAWTHEEVERVLDMKALSDVLRKRLPAYAVPAFLRVLPAAPTTGTFKHQKVALRKQGYDECGGDPVYRMRGAVERLQPGETPGFERMTPGGGRGAAKGGAGAGAGNATATGASASGSGIVAKSGDFSVAKL